MKHNVGDKVRIKNREWYDKCKDERGNVSMYPYDFIPEMSEYCGKEATILSVCNILGVCSNYLYYRIDIDSRRYWTDGMFVEDAIEDTELTSIRKLTNELADTLERKNHDYGNSFAYLFKKYGMTYSVIHLVEKVGRIETLANKVDGESLNLKDSLKDLAGYCILTLKELDNGRSS